MGKYLCCPTIVEWSHSPPGQCIIGTWVRQARTYYSAWGTRPSQCLMDAMCCVRWPLALSWHNDIKRPTNNTFYYTFLFYYFGDSTVTYCCKRRYPIPWSTNPSMDCLLDMANGTETEVREHALGQSPSSGAMVFHTHHTQRKKERKKRKRNETWTLHDLH